MEMVRLRDILYPVERIKVSVPKEKARLVTVKLHGLGAIERKIDLSKLPDSVTGNVIKEGQFIYSRIDARNGAFAIVPEELDGALVSNDFPTFEIDTDRAFSGFVRTVLETGYLSRLAASKSFGATNRQRLKENELLSFMIPLPPLAEQRRIAEKLGSVREAIKEANRLFEKLNDMASSLVSSAYKQASQIVPLASVCEINPRPPRGVSDSELTSFVAMSDVDERFGVTKYEKTDYGSYKKGYTYFEQGDLLVAKITPCFENGKSGLADIPTIRGHGSTEFHVVRSNSEVLTGDILASVVKQSNFIEAGTMRMRGSAGQRRIPTWFVENYPVPILSPENSEMVSSSLSIVKALKWKYLAKLEHLEELYTSLSQRAFSGRL